LRAYNHSIENHLLLYRLLKIPCVDPRTLKPAPRAPSNWDWKSRTFGLRIPLGNRGRPMG